MLFYMIQVSFICIEIATNIWKNHINICIIDVSFIRELEVYKAENESNKLKIYFLIYEESVEEQKYLTEIRKEKVTYRYHLYPRHLIYLFWNKDAFESLIKLKKHMIVPNLTKTDKLNRTNLDIPLSIDTRTIKPVKPKKNNPKVIIGHYIQNAIY